VSAPKKDATSWIAERIARRRAELDVCEEGPAAARRDLGEALRALLDVVCAANAEESEFRTLATAIRSSAQRWSEIPRASAPPGEGSSSFSGMEDFHDRSPLVGLANPIAPPMRLDPEMRDGEVRGEITFGNAYEGAPGCVHGGFLAAAFDEALGVACIFSGNPGMTGELTVRYLSPTPTHQRLDISARFERCEGRRIYTSGEIRAGSRVTSRAEGLFIAIGAEKFEELQRLRE
jgi:acyl-coenzyme A thioesterase PaaI-like protein